MAVVSRYARFADLVGAGATITAAAGTIDATYGLGFLHDRNPARPCKFTTGAAARLVWDFGAAQRIDAIVLPAHNLAAGAAVKFQGNASDAWGSPTVDAAITIPALPADGVPVSCWRNLTTATGYTASGFRYWSLSIPAQAVAPALGEVVLVSNLRRWTRGPRWGAVRTDVRRVNVGETEYGVRHVYDLGVRERRIDLAWLTTDAGVEDVRSVVAGARGPLYPWVLVLDESANEALYVTADAAELADTWAGPGLHDLKLTAREVARGLAL